MDPSTVVPAVAAAAGGLGGSGVMLWFSRLMFRRMIQQYDQAIKEFTRAIGHLDRKIAVVEVLVADAKSAKDSVDSIRERCGLIDAKAEKAHTRLDHLKEQFDKLESSIKILSGHVS